MKQSPEILVDALAVAKRYASPIDCVSLFGNGLINATYLVTSASRNFVLQRMNSRVFPEPNAIMANLEELTRHWDALPESKKTLDIPRLVRSSAGHNIVRDNSGHCWRALGYIDNTTSLESLDNLQQAYQVGLALGRFHCLLATLEVSRLIDTLPGFHITPAYLERYRRVCISTAALADRYCSEFIDQYHFLSVELEDAKSKGLLPLRVIHGDPKLNNFLFDKKKSRAVALIDLDTVKPGLLHYDIGDCLRSACHRSESDRFDLETAQAVLAGYFDEAGELLSAAEYEYLFAAIRLIPFELGLRFYTDYLDGDIYFKVDFRGQNLVRAQKQFRLCASIMAQGDSIKSLIQLLRRARRSVDA